MSSRRANPEHSPLPTLVGRLEGNVALITDGNSGIALAIAKEYVSEVTRLL